MSQKGFAPILIVIILAALVGGYLVYQKQAPSTNSGQAKPTPSPQPATQSSPTSDEANNQTKPEKIVEDFYKNYWNCLNRHFENSGGRGPRENCPFNKDGVLEGSLVEKLYEARGADPILCAQDLTLSIKVDKAQVTGDTARTTVHTFFEMSGDNQIIVRLTKKDGSWMINDIYCYTIQNR